MAGAFLGSGGATGLEVPSYVLGIAITQTNVQLNKPINFAADGGAAGAGSHSMRKKTIVSPNFPKPLRSVYRKKLGLE